MALNEACKFEREIAELRDRLFRLSQASLRINESLDFETVLQGALDSACSLTGTRYGVITLLDESGRIQDFVTYQQGARPQSGMQPLQRRPGHEGVASSRQSVARPFRNRTGSH